MATSTASATSMNFVGFEEMRGQGTPDLLHNRVFIMPNLPQTAGKWMHPVAGFLPGQQPYLKRQKTYWNKPHPKMEEILRLQGYRRFYGGYV